MDNPLRIAICENSDKDASLLLELCRKCGFMCEYSRFSSGEEFLLTFCQGLYDLIFMDIYMDGIRGIEVAAKIRETDKDVVIAFTTISVDHALEGYRLGALKYLEKPVALEGVKETLELAYLKRKTRASIKILAGGKYVDIPLDDIYYFEQCDHVVEVHTSSGVLRTSQTVRISDIEKQLPAALFVRCHYSFIVNLRYVLKVDEDYKFFVMKNGGHAHIRHKLMKKMKDAYEDYIFEATRSGHA